MNLPNVLTLLRIFFVPLLVAAMVGGSGREFLALAIFLAAAATDLLDGYLARRWKQITTVGTLLDPIADKLLISAALISLVEVGAVAGWVAILLIGREFAISGLRAIAAAEGYTIKSSDLAKSKMAFQVVAIAVVLVSLRAPEWKPVGSALLMAVLLVSMASAVLYFRQFWRKIDDRIKRRRRQEVLAMAREQHLQRKAARAAEETGSTHESRRSPA
jgi:CDP-diacylglycerol--glycerol-3-phosphate 3-phosphatidyltransferase